MLGYGIPQEEIEQVFLPFRRLSRTREKAAGTGLGLFSAKKIIEGHGGKIRIMSQTGKGTTVEITLPENARNCWTPFGDRKTDETVSAVDVRNVGKHTTNETKETVSL